jgi:processive 1,2-diacylglycerol beta-glucosyltransferase
VKGVPSQHVEVLCYTNPIFKRIYSDLYIDLMTRQPDLLGSLYKTLGRPWHFQKRQLALDRLNTGPHFTSLRKRTPDSSSVLIFFLRRFSSICGKKDF